MIFNTWYKNKETKSIIYKSRYFVHGFIWSGRKYENWNIFDPISDESLYIPISFSDVSELLLKEILESKV